MDIYNIFNVFNVSIINMLIIPIILLFSIINYSFYNIINNSNIFLFCIISFILLLFGKSIFIIFVIFTILFIYYILIYLNNTNHLLIYLISGIHSTIISSILYLYKFQYKSFDFSENNILYTIFYIISYICLPLLVCYLFVQGICYILIVLDRYFLELFFPNYCNLCCLFLHR